LQKYGKIDVVVSNAAANPSVEAILETKESVLDKLWEINVKASILLLKVSSIVKLQLFLMVCEHVGELWVWLIFMAAGNGLCVLKELSMW